MDFSLTDVDSSSTALTVRATSSNTALVPDGNITLGEMQHYLTDTVGKHAAQLNRKQEPEFIGEKNRILIGKH